MTMMISEMFQYSLNTTLGKDSIARCLERFVPTAHITLNLEMLGRDRGSVLRGEQRPSQGQAATRCSSLWGSIFKSVSVINILEKQKMGILFFLLRLLRSYWLSLFRKNNGTNGDCTGSLLIKE